MNGRAYDYNLGRFLSVDPFIQFPGNSQSLNPYSYIMNNPMAGTDPSGYIGLLDVDHYADIDALVSSGVGAESAIETVSSAKVSAAGTTLMVVDTTSNLVVPLKGFLKQGVKQAIKQGIKQAKKNGKDAVQGAKVRSSQNPSDIGSPGNRPSVSDNKAKGEAFERRVVEAKKSEQSNIRREITVETKSGTKTRVDCVGTCKKTGEIKLTEAKSSQSAQLTKNQRSAFPEIEKTGATVVGKGKAPFVGGTKIEPTKVKIIRPKDLEDKR